MKTARPYVQIAAWVFMLVSGVGVSSRAEDETASATSANCEEGEQYCAHKVAAFSEGGASVPVYEEGQCVPKTRNCSDFWCGPRRCSGGVFGKQVCCVKMSPGEEAQYSCAYSELNCPGNMGQLTIRPGS